jgi:hypothetical protein
MAGTVLGGSGIVPADSTLVFDELTALTRRAYIQKLIVQLYYSSPTLMLLMSNAQRSAGGLNQITFPVQGTSMVQGAWTGYTGSFNKPQVIPGVQAAAFNTSYFTVPVPLVMGEALLQKTEAIIPIIDARMNDVYAITYQMMAAALFSNNSANVLMPNSFVDAFDNGTTVSTYGGINRNTAANSFWKGQLYTGVAAGLSTRAAFSTRQMQMQDVAGGEAPDCYIMSPGDYSTLNEAFIGLETIRMMPGNEYSMDTPVRSSFPNLNINGIPIFADHFCPKGEAYAINAKYTSMFISEDANFAFSGFHSTIPVMQIAQVGVMLLGYNVLTSKPLASARYTGITGAAF